MAEIRVGISGWRYTPWRGVFYPLKLPQRLELWYASRVLSTIEINGSFYSLQRPEYFARWYAETPDDFIFAVKGPRFITHMKKLRDVETPLANFLASGVFNLKEKLGPMLWQFPPGFRYDRDKMGRFFEMLPRDTRQALHVARRRDFRLKGRARLAIDANRKMRYAVEIRHESFLDTAFIDQLREHHIALVVAETANKWPLIGDVTADFIYMRLHGDAELYKSGYGQRAHPVGFAHRCLGKREGANDYTEGIDIQGAKCAPPRCVLFFRQYRHQVACAGRCPVAAAQVASRI